VLRWVIFALVFANAHSQCCRGSNNTLDGTTPTLPKDQKTCDDLGARYYGGFKWETNATCPDAGYSSPVSPSHSNQWWRLIRG
jgi:hypothetical protein